MSLFKEGQNDAVEEVTSDWEGRYPQSPREGHVFVVRSAEIANYYIAFGPYAIEPWEIHVYQLRG